MSNSIEQCIQRKLTKAFINANPLRLALIPTILTRTENGARIPSDGPARPEQTFRLIGLTSQRVPITTTDGKERVHDMILVGEYDAEIAVGDHWIDEASGARLEVIMIEPKAPLDYIMRAFIFKHGD